MAPGRPIPGPAWFFECLGATGGSWSAREIGANVRNPVGIAQFSRVWKERIRSSMHLAQADLAQAEPSAGAGHHEWPCFACHQAAEKALTALHLHLGQQNWGHGIGRSFRDLPAPIPEALAAPLAELGIGKSTLQLACVAVCCLQTAPHPLRRFGTPPSPCPLERGKASVDFEPPKTSSRTAVAGVTGSSFW